MIIFASVHYVQIAVYNILEYMHAVVTFPANAH